MLGGARTVPAGVDLSAYRIIQEALTNVVKHAGTGARCAVSVRYADNDLIIRVTDDGGQPAGRGRGRPRRAGGTGHGIIGMRERVTLCGGTFSAGPLPGGGFQVTATLPLPAAGTAAASEAVTARGTATPATPSAPRVPATAPEASASAVSIAGVLPAVAGVAGLGTGAVGRGGGQE